MDHVAVIDIGSNSIRLVIYDGLSRSPFPLFNEKQLCGLAIGLETTKRLNPEGRQEAKHALSRFITLAKKIAKKHVYIIATSAARDAEDGEAFIQEIQKQHRVTVDILSEAEEAAYAAYGICASVTDPHGIVGDLGGGSFELTAISHNNPEDGISLPIGPLRFSNNISKAEYGHISDHHLSQFHAKDSSCYKHFYAVGGAFRALAKIHMERKNYPLKVIHHYTVKTKELLSTLQIVQRMSDSALQKIVDIPKKRIQYLPYTATLLMRYIERFSPEDITFSAHGVREGALYSKLPERNRRQDPLISGCKNFMGYFPDLIAYGEAVNQWIQPITDAIPLLAPRILQAACILGEISFQENPDYRAELAYRRILDASFLGITHKERFILAKILFCRYAKNPNSDVVDIMQCLLSEEEIRQSQIAGAAIRVAKSLSASNVKLLEKTSLTLHQGRLTLHLKKGMASLYGEAIEKRIHHLGYLLECNSYEIKNG